MLKRIKIWYLFGTRSELYPKNGDSINECRALTILSQFADVYYNGVLVHPDDESFGTPEGINIPDQEYDIYIVRGNPDIFSELPSPKLYGAIPYDEECFRQADGVFVSTSIWRDILLNDDLRKIYKTSFDKWYPEDAYFPPSVVQLKQACDAKINSAKADNRSCNNWKYRLTNQLSFGFYGRLAVDALPASFVSYHKQLFESEGASAPVLAFAGGLRRDLKNFELFPKNAIYLGLADYLDMTNLLTATDYTLAGETEDDVILGSNKILDSINCGTPVICQRNKVREEYLGEAYLGLYNDVEELAKIVEYLRFDENFKNELEIQTHEAAELNQVKQTSIFNEIEIMNFIGSQEQI